MPVSRLKTTLDELTRRFHREDFLPTDPLEFVHRYTDPWDQEVVALLAAVLAYGNAQQVRRSVANCLDRMAQLHPSPATFVRSLATDEGRAAGRAVLRSHVHRFNRGDDLSLLFELLQRSWAQYGSLGGHFLTHLDPTAETFADALDALIADWRAWAGAELRGSFRYLLTAPVDGSCCKRWCMLLRWMGRADELDPGLWMRGGRLAATFPPGRGLKPSQLVIPLDTHVGNISRRLGLRRRKTLDWKAALEITGRLRKFDPADPIRYDFAIVRAGMLKQALRRSSR